jgi:hypothetical protein
LLSIFSLSDNEFKLSLVIFWIFIIKQNENHVFHTGGKSLLRYQVTGNGKEDVQNYKARASKNLTLILEA